MSGHMRPQFKIYAKIPSRASPLPFFLLIRLVFAAAAVELELHDRLFVICPCTDLLIADGIV